MGYGTYDYSDWMNSSRERVGITPSKKISSNIT